VPSIKIILKIVKNVSIQLCGDQIRAEVVYQLSAVLGSNLITGSGVQNNQYVNYK